MLKLNLIISTILVSCCCFTNSQWPPLQTMPNCTFNHLPSGRSVSCRMFEISSLDSCFWYPNHFDGHIKLPDETSNICIFSKSTWNGTDRIDEILNTPHAYWHHMQVVPEDGENTLYINTTYMYKYNERKKKIVVRGPMLYIIGGDDCIPIDASYFDGRLLYMSIGVLCIWSLVYGIIFFYNRMKKRSTKDVNYLQFK